MLCLQGGAEFGPRCAEMDTALLHSAGDGPVVVTALAGAPGADYLSASENGVRHFRDLGATSAVVAPDARQDPDAALPVLRSAGLLVLPGGSPSRLLEALETTGAGDAVRDVLARGGAVMGASAGAMVLCDWVVLPDRRGPAGPAVVRGLGIAERLLVVPHWSGGSSRGDWLRAIDAAVPSDVTVVGLAEQSGVLVQDGGLAAVGASAAYLVTEELEVPVGSTWRRR